MRKTVLTLALLFGLASVAQAAITVTIPNVTFTGPQTVVSITVPVSGPDLVHQFDAFIQIGDGAGGGGTGSAPPISYLGSPTDASNNFMSTSAHNFIDEGSDPFNVDIGDILATANSNISVSTNGGLLLTLLVDLTGKVAGSWPLIGDDLGNNGAGDFRAQVSNAPVNIASTWLNGSVTIVPIPEPSSIILGLFAAAGLGVVAVRKRRARRA
jgi:hypothetical protein